MRHNLHGKTVTNNFKGNSALLSIGHGQTLVSQQIACAGLCQEYCACLSAPCTVWQWLLAGTPANASTSNLSPPLSVSRGPAAAPSAAVSLPPGLGGLADAAAASLGAPGSHVLLLSVTTVGGFCAIVLLAAAAVFCALRRRRNKRKAYLVERKPSESQASYGGSGRGAQVQPSPHKTTPKGLRQAYAKAAGLYRGNVTGSAPVCSASAARKSAFAAPSAGPASGRLSCAAWPIST